MLFAGVIRTSDNRHGSVGEMYANQRHMMVNFDCFSFDVGMLGSEILCQ